MQKLSSNLAHLIEHFQDAIIQTIRTATPEVERINQDRVRLSVPVELICQGRVHAGILTEISPGGTKIKGVQLAVGETCTLTLDGITVSAVVWKVKKEHVRLHFQDTDEAGMNAWIDRHRRPKAA